MFFKWAGYNVYVCLKRKGTRHRWILHFQGVESIEYACLGEGGSGKNTLVGKACVFGAGLLGLLKFRCLLLVVDHSPQGWVTQNLLLNEWNTFWNTFAVLSTLSCVTDSASSTLTCPPWPSPLP